MMNLALSEKGVILAILKLEFFLTFFLNGFAKINILLFVQKGQKISGYYFLTKS